MTVESSKSPVAATPKTTIASAADSGADSGGDDVELKGQVCMQVNLSKKCVLSISRYRVTHLLSKNLPLT